MIDPQNIYIKEALDKGLDATGLCTVRDLVGYMHVLKEDVTELAFVHEGIDFLVRVEIKSADKK